VKDKEMIFHKATQDLHSVEMINGEIFQRAKENYQKSLENYLQLELLLNLQKMPFKKIIRDFIEDNFFSHQSIENSDVILITDNHIDWTHNVIQTEVLNRFANKDDLVLLESCESGQSCQAPDIYNLIWKVNKLNFVGWDNVFYVKEILNNIESYFMTCDQLNILRKSLHSQLQNITVDDLNQCEAYYQNAIRTKKKIDSLNKIRDASLVHSIKEARKNKSKNSSKIFVIAGKKHFNNFLFQQLPHIHFSIVDIKDSRKFQYEDSHKYFLKPQGPT
tara:strand:- start:1865 stop:2692 length:828 start_codon:yes stop_codon:yes gene_type:complete